MEKQEIRQYASDLLDYCNNKLNSASYAETINVVINNSRHKHGDTDFTIVSVDVYDDKADTRIFNAEIMMNHAYTKEEDVKNFLYKVDEVFKSLPKKIIMEEKRKDCSVCKHFDAVRNYCKKCKVTTNEFSVCVCFKSKSNK